MTGGPDAMHHHQGAARTHLLFPVHACSTDMTDVDIVMVFVDSTGTVWAMDMWSIGDKPRFDTDFGSPDNIDRASLAGSVKDGVTTVTFQRPLDTGDRSRDAVIRSGRMDVIFAWSLQPVQPGVDGGMAYHGASRGTISVDFFSGSSSCGSVGVTSTIQVSGVASRIRLISVSPRLVCTTPDSARGDTVHCLVRHRTCRHHRRSLLPARKLVAQVPQQLAEGRCRRRTYVECGGTHECRRLLA